MNILKKILIALAIIVAIPLIIALFVEKDFAVEREIIINKPSQQVFDYLKILKNQDHFSVWNQRDPAMKKEYKGTDGTVGFIASWDSEKKEVGKGSQEIVNIQEGNRLDTKLHFQKPFEAEDDAYFITEKIADNQTKVKWGFKGGFPYPMNIMRLFVDMDKQLGGDLAAGLTNLKSVLESQ
jgi:hypothetical protein